jgi:hypothetical protein
MIHAFLSGFAFGLGVAGGLIGAAGLLIALARQ